MRKISYIEIILGVTFLFMVSGFFYSWSKNSTLNQRSKEISKIKQDVSQILNYKKTWEMKRINRKVEHLRRVLKSGNIKDFKISRSKAYIRLVDLDIRTINRFLVKLSSLPVQFITLEVDSNGEKYNMECRCKW
jgi:hypothetical protein